MGKRRLSETKQRWKYVACDYVTSFISFLVFNIFRCRLFYPDDNLLGYILSNKLIAEEIIIPFGMLGIYWLSGYYNRPFGKSRLQEMITTLFSSLLNTIFIYLVLLINDQTGERLLNYELLATLEGLLFIIPYIGRLIITSVAITRFKNHRWEFRTLIVGDTEESRNTGRRLSESTGRAGVDVVGYIAVEGDGGVADGERIFPIGNIEEVCRDEEIDQIVISGVRYNEDKVLKLLYRLFHLGIPIKIAPDTFSYVTSAIRLQDIYGEPFVDLTSPALSESSRNVKRVLDVVVSALVLIILSPLYLILAILVKSDSPGPAFYSQERIGRRQKPFMIYKFRTMRSDAESSGPQLASDNDPRVTRIGRVLRKYRLDELPQFWNVLKGEMSIVGPRPERAYFIERIMREAPYYTLVYQVRPGITSWGMVKYGYASDVSQMVERTRYDLIYLSNMSLSVDIKILIYTVKTVLTGRGM